jgi:hypothetical protein
LFILSVSDGSLSSSPDSVYITVRDLDPANRAPVADAGDDQTVDENSRVDLDGSGSSDPDHDALSYDWSTPSDISLSDAGTAQPYFTAPDVDSETTYLFILSVSDGSLSSSPDSVYITVRDLDPANRAPVADAGDDQTVDENSRVDLDGSGSSDPDQDALSYDWSTPSDISLSDAGTAQPYFTAPDVDSETTYLFILSVSDGSLSSSPDSVYITVRDLDPANRAPVADAGDDVKTEESETVVLDGSGSYDPDNDSLEYIWNAPEIISLSDQSAIRPSFNAPDVASDTIVYVSLKVFDGALYSASDSINIHISDNDVVNHPPVADAGRNKTATEASRVQLDGSDSYDPDKDSLYYHWESPGIIDLSDSTAVRPEMSVPKVESDTTFNFYLTVSDGSKTSSTDTVKIKVENVATAISEHYMSNQPAFTIYPNPVQNRLNIQSEAKAEVKDLQFLFYSVDGKLELMKERYGLNLRDNKVDLDVSGLPAGVYIFRIQSGDKVLLRKKLIKR